MPMFLCFNRRSFLLHNICLRVGLLCSGSIVKIFTPCIGSTRLLLCILHNKLKLLFMFAARKLFGVDNISFSVV